MSHVAPYAVTDPVSGRTLRTYDVASDRELGEALARAHAAAKRWGRLTAVRDRAAVLSRVAGLYRDRRELLAPIVVREMGKPIAQALAEVELAADIYDFYADNAEELLADEPVRLAAGDGAAWTRRSPLGVLLGIMPWNYPYYQVARFAAPNLLLGNTILLKHAPQCPESAAAATALFAQAGLPAGAYEGIYASNDQVETLIGDERVRGVSLTGSERAGAAVAEVAGRHLKKVVLELGGSDPFIVLSTSDMDATVQMAVAARLENAGQTCTAAKRFIVVDELYDDFVSRLATALGAIEPGDPLDPGTAVGPLASPAAADRLDDQVRRAVEQGATLLTGGVRRGAFFAPALLTDVSPDNDAYSAELFGPVAQAYRVRDEQAAVELANDSPYGLGSYVITVDEQQAVRVADQLEAGMVFINAVDGDGPALPFGGVKRSGFGRELGQAGVDEFANRKLIRLGAATPWLG